MKKLLAIGFGIGVGIFFCFWAYAYWQVNHNNKEFYDQRKLEKLKETVEKDSIKKELKELTQRKSRLTLVESVIFERAVYHIIKDEETGDTYLSRYKGGIVRLRENVGLGEVK